MKSNFETEMISIIMEIVEEKKNNFIASFGGNPHYIAIPQGLQSLLCVQDTYTDTTPLNEGGDRVFLIGGLQVCPSISLKSLNDIVVF